MTTDKKKEQSQKRQQALRNRRLALGLKKVTSVLSNKEAGKLRVRSRTFFEQFKPI